MGKVVGITGQRSAKRSDQGHKNPSDEPSIMPEVNRAFFQE